MSFNFSFGLPLKQHYVEFIAYEDYFLPHEANRVLSLWDAEKSGDATLSGRATENEELRKSSVIFIEEEPSTTWIYQKMAALAMQTNNERFWFDLLGFHEKLQLTNYSVGDHFNWHQDFGAGEISSRKLSMTVQLSDPDEYEGGDLEFMVNHNIMKAPRKKGTIVVFPSFIMHRVTPITKGTRRSIVGWVAGSPYR
jgi:PKHD-type hydroxylase